MPVTSSPRYALTPRGRLTVRIEGLLSFFSLGEIAMRHGLARSSMQFLMRRLSTDQPDGYSRIVSNLVVLHALWAADTSAQGIEDRWQDAISEALKYATSEPGQVVAEALQQFEQLDTVPDYIIATSTHEAPSTAAISRSTL